MQLMNKRLGVHLFLEVVALYISDSWELYRSLKHSKIDDVLTTDLVAFYKIKPFKLEKLEELQNRRSIHNPRDPRIIAKKKKRGLFQA